MSQRGVLMSIHYVEGAMVYRADCPSCKNIIVRVWNHMGWGHPSDRGEIAGWFQPPVSEHTSHFILKAFFTQGKWKKTWSHLSTPTWTTRYCQQQTVDSWQKYAWTKKQSYQLQSSRSPYRTTQPISSLSPTISFVLPPLTDSAVLLQKYWMIILN